MNTNLSWYVVHTKPRQEKAVEDNLLRQGYQVYLPYIKIIKRVRGQMETRLEPMFSRYCFFKPAHSEHSITPVNSSFGVSRIVRFGAVPAMVSPRVLERIQAVEMQQQNVGFPAIVPSKPGQTVFIDSGPLKGMEGLVSEVAEERIIVLLNLLGREPRVVVQLNCVKIA